MENDFLAVFQNFWKINVVNYLNELQENPFRVVMLALDITIVIFLVYKFVKATRNSRV